VDVTVVLHVGTVAGADSLAGFEFNVGMWQQAVFTPLVPAVCDAGGQDCNPDLDQGSLGNGFNCGAPFTPVPDLHPSGDIAVSSLVCLNGGGTGPAFATGADIALATVHYAAHEGTGTFGLASTQVYGWSAGTILSCNPDSGGIPVTCFGATVTVDEEGATATATPTGTPSADDSDGDGIPDAIDNCAGIRNPTQLNSDRNFVELPIAKPFDDTSRAHSDNLGDECDADDDNDGFADAVEGVIGPAGVQHEVCPSASGDTNPLVADSDSDGTIDGAECALGTDPANPASKPTIVEDGDTDGDGLGDAIEAQLGSDPNDVDTDGDGVLDGIEFRGYHTDPTLMDTDGDGCSDGKEIASVDGLSSVNSIDLQQVAQSFSSSQAAPNYILDFDVTKNGQINSIDLQFVARQFGRC
jgi:hypothetical protein